MNAELNGLNGEKFIIAFNQIFDLGTCKTMNLL